MLPVTKILSMAIPSMGVGLAGMVMASLGLLAAHSLFEQGRSVRERAGRGILAACLLFILIGLDMKSDILVHMLGFVTGFVSGLVLCLSKKRLPVHGRFDAIAAVICGVVLAATWALALRG